MPERESYRPIEALERGLEVLAAIGQDGADIMQIGVRTGINRTTIYRVLHTLERNGYLIRSSSDHRYRLSMKVRSLSDGFTDSVWVTGVALAELGELLKNVAWPGNIATFDGRYMLIRESTHRFSTMMPHRNMVGKKLPLSTSLGLAFLAFSPPTVVTAMIAPLLSDLSTDGSETMTRNSVQEVLSQVKAQGFVTRLASWETGVGGIAMPIMRGDYVLACINVVMRDDVLNTPALLQPIASHLAEAVKRVEAKLRSGDMH